MIRWWREFRTKHGKRGIFMITALPALVVVLLLIYMVRRESGVRVKPRKGPIVEAVYALGTVKADNTYTFKVGITGSILNIHVTEGDVVGRGAPLVTTDSATFSSPIAGTVTRVSVQRGETIMPGVPVVTVMDLSKKYVQLSMDQESALLVRVGQPVELSFESIRGQKISGKVERMYPSEGQFLVRVRVDKMPPEILPDMSADVAIETARREDVIQIPVAAVKRGQVTVFRGGRSKERVNVKIGAINAEWAEVQDDSIHMEDEVLVPEPAKQP